MKLHLRFHLLFLLFRAPKLFLTTTLFLIFSLHLQSAVIYVDIDAGGAADGTSWTDAYTDLKQAITAAMAGDEIWVADGTYTPTTGTARNTAFALKNDVAIYGGFAGGESSVTQRDWVANVTILSGDIGTVGDDSDNSHTIINNGFNNANSSAILDGFTITKANGNGPQGFNNQGGGIYNRDSSPTITNCIFTDNVSSIGGAFFLRNSNSVFTNCLFVNNSALVAGGGAGGYIEGGNSSPVFNNCTMALNSPGGIMRIFSGAPQFTNCIIRGQLPSSGTPSYSHSIIPGGNTCTNCPNGNGNVDPLFVGGDDFSLQNCSPAIEAGDNSANSEAKDLDGNNRIFNTTIDIGAYEFQNNQVTITCYLDDDDDTFGNVSISVVACDVCPTDYVLDDTDCDDSDDTIYPNAPEICDGIDNDCDGSVDEDVLTTFYADTDGDGFGDPANTTQACSQPNGYVTDDTDCDDSEATVYPGAPEICDGLDNDCDGDTDDDDADITGQSTFYEDGDNDGFGNPNSTILACSVPSGYVANDTDCDDTDDTINPNATEICGDNIDNNCDGQVDENCANYCTSSGQSTSYEWIKKVILGDIHNNSGDNGGYADFTNQSTDVSPGDWVTITLKPGFSGFPYFERWRVWVDWNQDGDFTDWGEKEVQAAGWGTKIRVFKVPHNATLGTTQMRVSMKYGSYPKPCQHFSNGEVEDYTINVVNNSGNRQISNDQLQLATKFEFGEVDLTWFNNTGFKNDLFVIEKSTDGTNFEPINEQLSLTSESSEMYRDKDIAPQTGTNYYRIKLLLNDNSTMYSNVQQIELDQNPAEIAVFPNPAEYQVFIAMKELGGRSGEVQIVNQLGKVFYQKDFESLPETPLNVDLNDFTSGIYFIKMSAEGRRAITKRLVVVNEN